MHHARPTLRWMARWLSSIVSGAFLLISMLAVFNEDKPAGAAIPLLALLALTIVGCGAAWRWEKAGGLAVISGALGLTVAAYAASLTYGPGSLSVLPALIYGSPFLVVGVLFWASGQRQPAGAA